MKLITLNTWGGRIEKGRSLLKFIKEKSEEVDIFCFQEIYHNAKGKELLYLDDNHELFDDLSKQLNDFHNYFHPQIRDYSGLALFIRKNISVNEFGEVFVYKTAKERDEYINHDDDGNHPRNVQYVVLEKNGNKFVIANFHGLWTGTGKEDTPERIEQSKKIAEFLSRFNYPTILAGDFNLEPQTKSIAILEEEMKNLIKEYNIQDTRTSHYTKEVRFADYVFTKNVHINDFKVLPDEVSDHAPLYLDFDI